MQIRNDEMDALLRNATLALEALVEIDWNKPIAETFGPVAVAIEEIAELRGFLKARLQMEEWENA